MADKQTASGPTGETEDQTLTPKQRSEQPEQPEQAPEAERAPAEKTPAKTAKTAKAAAPAKATKATKAAKTTKAAKASRSAKPDKKTADAPTARKARRPAKAQPSEPAPATGAAPDSPPASERRPNPSLVGSARSFPPPGAWAQAAGDALRNPDEPPRRLIALAVVELGPRAAAWAAWLRETYPDAPAYGVARLATWQARRHGVLLTTAGLTGPLAAAVQPIAGAAADVLLVLRIAAAYGHDPADPARAADLIELLDLDADGSPVARGLGVAGGALTRLGRAARVRRLGRRPASLAWLWALASAGDRAERMEQLAHRAERHFRDGKPPGER